MDKNPEQITPALLDCVVMPNGEIICAGKTIGWVKDIGEFIKVKKEGRQRIAINITPEDASDLEQGGEFEWAFPSNTGETIDVYLFGCDDEEKSEEIIENYLEGDK